VSLFKKKQSDEVTEKEPQQIKEKKKFSLFKKKNKEKASDTLQDSKKDESVAKDKKSKKEKTVSIDADYGVKLTAKQKKKIVREIRERNKQSSASVQSLIPYTAMFRDGICRISNHQYSKMIAFSDINYETEDDNVHAGIFDAWCDFLNYFDSSVTVQICSVVLKIDINELEKNVIISNNSDDPEIKEIQDVYSEIIRQQLIKGNNEYSRVKYIVFGVDSDSIKNARVKLNGITRDLVSSLESLNIKAHPLNGVERLEVMRNMLNPLNFEPFLFNYDLVKDTGLSTKDFIAPTSVEFTKNDFCIGENNCYGKSFRLDIKCEKLNDGMLRKLMEENSNIMCSIHLKSLNNEHAIKLLKRKLTNIESSKVSEQQKAARKGYDIDILPPDLVTYDKDVTKTLRNVESGADHMFITTVIFTVMEKDQKTLNTVVDSLKSTARQYSCFLKPLDYKQKEGLVSSLPLAYNEINVQHKLQTRSVAGLMPFTTVELFQKTGEQLYGGLNQLSGNIIMTDRKKLDNPNGLILGTPGGGKSFFVKKEILSTYGATDDDIMICDPESEYGAITRRLKGQVIVISPASTDYLNPLDINLMEGDNIENAIKEQTDYLLNLFNLMIGGRYGLDAGELSMLDNAAQRVYESYFENPVPENMPTLTDIYNIIAQREDSDDKNSLCAKMERFVTGTSNFFNHRTNVDVNNRIVCYDIQGLGEQLKKVAMATVQNHVWHRVRYNRAHGKYTRYYMDEFHLLLRDKQTAEYSLEVFKRFRKFGGIPTGITQNVTDLTSSPQVQNIFANCEYIVMLKQKGEDVGILEETLGIPHKAIRYVTNNAKGSGLLFYGGIIIPFEDDFPKDNIVYDTITTNLADLAKKMADKDNSESLEQNELKDAI